MKAKDPLTWPVLTAILRLRRCPWVVLRRAPDLLPRQGRWFASARGEGVQVLRSVNVKSLISFQPS